MAEEKATYRHEVFTDAQSLGTGNRFPDLLHLSSVVVVVVVDIVGVEKIDASRGDDRRRAGAVKIDLASA